MQHCPGLLVSVVGCQCPGRWVKQRLAGPMLCALLRNSMNSVNLAVGSLAGQPDLAA